MNEKLWNYLRNDKRQIRGWLQRVDAEIFGAILELQIDKSISGACVEIGVHFGKSFIPLCLSTRENERALCIDIFEDQSKNLDFSGHGDFEGFKNNLINVGINLSKIEIIKSSSEDVNEADILDQVGPVRFFSIDGGHWSAIVQNDLELAEKVLAEGGVIALDDYCRVEWPDVTYAYSLWQDKTKSDIVPFACGSNKLYLCRKNMAQTYRDALKTPFLLNYYSKTYATEKSEMDCYRVEPSEQDESRTLHCIEYALKVFKPDLFQSIQRFRKKR